MTIAPLGAVPPCPAGPAAPGGGFAAALEARAVVPRPPAAAPPAARPHPASAALATVERAQARLDQVLAQARAGRTFTAAELLALQAEAYRCAQVVDLGAKLAEQGAQSVKQALNTPL